MICLNCSKDEYVTTTTSKEITVNGRVVLECIECEKCPECGDIIFTHQQSLEFDKKRISLEFGSKTILTSFQLKLLRKILDISLEDICELLHIGKSTYGRWERGEIAITPSMNLLVHNLIERIPDAKVNLIETEMISAIKKAKDQHLKESISLGEFLRQIINTTKILPEIICAKTGLTLDNLRKIQNNEVFPEKIPVETSGNIARIFQLSIDNLKILLENTLSVCQLRKDISFIHTRKSNYGKEGSISQSKSINKILEQYLYQEKSTPKETISREYLERVDEYLMKQKNGR